MINRIVTTAKVASRRNESGEWVVRAYDQNGARFADADYFTNDRADAVATAAAMIGGNPATDNLHVNPDAGCY